MNWRYDDMTGGNGEMAGGAYHFLGATADEVSEPVDVVNKPPHYNQGEIECIAAIEAALTPEEFRGHCKANAIKYVWRERKKGGDESIRKAIWYLSRLVEK